MFFRDSETAGVALVAPIMPGSTPGAAAKATSIPKGISSRFTDEQRSSVRLKRFAPNDQTGSQNNRLYIAVLKIGALLAPFGKPMGTRSQVQLRGYSEPQLRCRSSTAPDLGTAQTASVPR